ncbi:ChaN family lipoprotein [Roseobacter sp.]|uniref:ChaN family lipoprotein n=1 Tax=Roseobacter sp. TaxID=1907202 RepID=UPI0038593C4D
MAAPCVFADTVLVAAQSADVVFLGEQHDNPGHHDVQARWTRALNPAALVFEMLTPEQAASITQENRSTQDKLAAALEWDSTGWPDFSMYYPIIEAAPEARIFGAGVPRAQVQSLMKKPLHEAMVASDVQRFGLDQPLPDAQQSKRESLQSEAHCNALPDDLLPMMVSVQRLRNATLARSALDALDQTTGPVLVITGNGHARTDWGAPFLVQLADPDVDVFALGQGEGDSNPQGIFDAQLDGPVVDRGNPCDAFK